MEGLSWLRKRSSSYSLREEEADSLLGQLPIVLREDWAAGFLFHESEGSQSQSQRESEDLLGISRKILQVILTIISDLSIRNEHLL